MCDTYYSSNHHIVAVMSKENHVSLEFLIKSSEIKNDFTTIFRILLPYVCSQNWDSDGHFEVLNMSRYWLVQKLWHKTQISPFLFFWFWTQTKISVLLRFYFFCSNKDLDSLSTAKWLSESQFYERWTWSWQKKWPEMIGAFILNHSYWCQQSVGRFVIKVWILDWVFEELQENTAIYLRS